MTSKKSPNGQQAGTTRQPGAASRLSRYLALEQRVLLDAAAVETAEKIAASAAQDSAVDAVASADSLLAAITDVGLVASPLPAAGGATQVLLVDAGIDNYQSLIAGLGANVEVHVLQAGDWATQIEAVLANRDGDVSAIHLVSHGGTGHLTIGGETIDAASLDYYGSVWSAMRQALTADGDLLVYGCDVAAGDAGRAFADALAQRTGADVAASEDLSGVASLGGDWELEWRVGVINAQALYGDDASGYDGILADGWVQDTEVSTATTTGTASAAILQTYDMKEWKFVGQAGSNRVYIFVRDSATGLWSQTQVVTNGSSWTGAGTGSFGYDIAASGNKLAVSAPTWDNGSDDGRVYVFTYNGTNWTTTAVETITFINPNLSGSGLRDVDNGSDNMGYSIDMAWNGNPGNAGGEYRLVIGNPTQDFDRGAFTSDKSNVGVAYVLRATAGGQFEDVPIGQMSPMWDNSNVEGDQRFGEAVSVGYDVGNNNWWVAVGASGRDRTDMYLNPTGNKWGTSLTAWGQTQNIAGWDSTGPNDISVHDDYMSIGLSTGVNVYKLNAAGTSWSLATTISLGGNANVSISDLGRETSSGTLIAGTGVTILSFVHATNGNQTYVGREAADGTWSYELVNTRNDLGVAIDRVRGLDAVGGNLSGSASWHFNWDPDTVDDVGVTNEDTSVVLTAASILSNDTDPNIVNWGTLFGDSLVLSGGSVVTPFGATVTVTGTQVTYNPTTSTYLQTLAVGQSTTETITITVSDGQGGSATSSLTFTINGVNDAPVATALTPLSPYAYQQSGSTNAYDFSIYFTDVDSGEADGLIPSAFALPAGWSAVVDGSLLRVTAPAGTAAGNYTITVRVQDAQGAFSATRDFVIAIDDANNAPFVQSAIPDQVALSGYDYSFTLPSETFGDPDPAPFDNITYTATLSSGAALPAWLTFDPLFRTFTGSPAAGDAGSITVRVTANDNAAAARGGPATAFDDFTLTIVNPTVKTLTAFTDGPAAGANFGFSTAISEDGNWLAVGAPSHNNYGSVWMYQWNGSGWTYITGLTPTTAVGSQVGWSIDLSDDGTKMIIGARSENGGRGAVYCYTRAGSVFTLNARLTANASAADDHFGSAVAINEAGTYVLIGASHFDYGGLTDSGAAFMAAFPAANGALTANVLPKDPSEFDLFGSSVAFDQNVLAVSALRDDNSQGMVSRIAFDETGGNYAASTFGSVGGTLSANAQFFYDGTRGEVVYLTGSDGKVTLDAPIDLGASWTISAWYKDMVWSGVIGTPDASYNTLTRGSSDHQVIVNAGTNDLGAWNNTGVGVGSFIPANIYEQQLLVVDSATTTTFTLTVPGVGTTAAIAHSTTAATMATNVQNALNTLLGTAGTATVTVVTDAAGSDILRVTFNNSAVNYNVMSTSRAGVSASREAQTLAFSATGNFTLTVDGVGTTASITYNQAGATQATNIQTALNTLLGAGATTVTTVIDTASSPNDTYVVQFNNIAGYNLLTASKAVTATRIVAANSTYALTAAQMSGWHNITAVGEGTGVNARTYYYMDGVKVGVANFKPTDDIAAVGNYQGNGQRFSNYLDDFRVYDRALSQSEIRNIYSGTAATDSPYGDTGSIYVFSTDAGNAQVAKLYAPDGRTGDMVGWSLDLDIYNIGATSRQGGIIVASSIYNDDAATDGGAVYVWRSTSQASGPLNNGGTGNGTWILETKLTSFDTSAGDYYGSDVAVDYDEATGGTRLLVGSQFEDTNGAYAGAVYAYKHLNGVWLPEKFVSAAPQGGSKDDSEFFGSSVAVADTRAVIGARWRDTGGQVNDGAVYWADLLTQGNYSTVLSAETSAAESFFLSASEMDVVALDTSSTQGTISFAADGRMVYTPGAAFKTLGVGQTATDTFTYLTEQGGITYTNVVTVTVHGVDDGVQAGNDVIQVSASSATLLNVLANDLAPDSVGLLSIGSMATGGTVGRVYNTGGALVYDPAGRFDALAAGEAVQEVFSYTVTNPAGQTSTAYVTLLVVGVDDPVIAVDDAATVKADSVLTVNVVGNDFDKDGVGTFGVVAVDDSGALGSAMINPDGTISYLPGSAFRYLKAGETATDTLVYRVRDATGNESTALLVITVVGVNDAPVAFNDGVAVAAGATVDVNVLANDVDPDGGALQVTRLITDGTQGGAVLNADGTISYTATAAGGLDKFSYEVVDSLGKTSIATVYVNHPDGVPGTGAVNDVAVVRGMSPVSIALTANDGGDAVVTGVSADGAAGSLTLGEDGVAVYTPDAALAKLPAGRVFVDTFTYTVAYGDGSTGSATLRVYVNGQYVAPALDLEEDERFVLPETVRIEASILIPSATPASEAVGPQVPPVDNVAHLALQGLIEMSSIKAQQAEAPAAPAEAAPAAEQPAQPVEVGKPGLSAALGRHVLEKRAGVDALLRHFADHAA